jgi:hypothetical protein
MRVTDEPRTNLGPPATSPTDHLQTVHGLVAHFDHLPVTVPTCHPDIQTNFGPSPFLPTDGSRASGPL